MKENVHFTRFSTDFFKNPMEIDVNRLLLGWGGKGRS